MSVPKLIILVFAALLCAATLQNKSDSSFIPISIEQFRLDVVQKSLRSTEGFNVHEFIFTDSIGTSKAIHHLPSELTQEQVDSIGMMHYEAWVNRERT